MSAALDLASAPSDGSVVGSRLILRKTTSLPDGTVHALNNISTDLLVRTIQKPGIEPIWNLDSLVCGRVVRPRDRYREVACGGGG